MSNDESTKQMSDDQFDNRLKRMFAENVVTLPANDFVLALQPQLHRADRRKVAIQWGIAVAAMIVAALLTPIVATITLNAFSAAAQVSRLPIAEALSMAGMVITTGIVWIWSRARIRSL